MKVLIVEDDTLIVRAIVRYLTGLRHDVQVAGSSEEAIRLLGEARFDFVLVDQGLRDGQRGLQVIEHVRAVDPSVRCCLTSGGSDVGPTSMQGKNEIFHAKPLTPSTLGRLLVWAQRRGDETA